MRACACVRAGVSIRAPLGGLRRGPLAVGAFHGGREKAGPYRAGVFTTTVRNKINNNK